MNWSPESIATAHRLYCELTGQRLSLGFDRERLWFELLRSGVTLEDLRRVIQYLQREIREGRRNIGALKLSNLLQPDRFEEDLQITRIRLEPASPPRSSQPASPLPSPKEDQRARERALELLRQFRRSLR